MFFHFDLCNQHISTCAELSFFTCVLSSSPVFKIFALACDLKVRNAFINLSLWLDDIFVAFFPLKEPVRFL